MKIAVLCSPSPAARVVAARARAYHVARTLAQELSGAHVTLAHTLDFDFAGATESFRTVPFRWRDIGAIAASHDVVIASEFPPGVIWRSFRTRFVLDLYAPFFAEWYAVGQSVPADSRRAWVELKQRELFTSMTIADFVLCANERQRDLLIGMLGSLGLISTRGYDNDTSLRSLIDVAPFGVEPPPTHRSARFRGVYPGIDQDDVLLAWNAPETPPYDPTALIRAVHRVAQSREDVKLVFGRPRASREATHSLSSGGAPEGEDLVASHAQERGLLGRHVFVTTEEWQDEDREASLSESDIGVCVYRDCIDTRYDAGEHYGILLTASLPLICTAGDPMSEAVDRERLGLTVPEGDEAALVAAILRLAADPEFRTACSQRVADLRAQMGWASTLRPLVEFCSERRPLAVRRRERLMPMVTQLLRRSTAGAHYRAQATDIKRT